MEAKKIGDITVNDGNGLFDNEGLCDSLIMDCNNAVKTICAGNYIAFCNTMVQMVQKLSNLKDGIKKDMASKNKIIEELKEQNNRLVEQFTGLPVEKAKDGEGNGTD